MRRLILLLLSCVVVAALSGCGQKGPLYLPPPTKPASASSTVKPAPLPPPNSIVPDNQQPAIDQY
jgi:predicted small lipoprotein YifL